MTLAGGVVQSPGLAAPNRGRYLRAFAILLAAGLALDPSIYVAGLTHVYLHDGTALGALALALVVMKGAHSARIPRTLFIPLGLLLFLAVDTIVVGAVNYPGAPAVMHKLFWFEHLDALRIIGELFVWIWTFGLLRPTRAEAIRIFDVVLWGGVAGVFVTGALFIAAKAVHQQTTAFDLTIMLGLPMSLVFALRRSQPLDLIRLGVFGAGSLLLYSRTAMVIIVITSVLVLLAARDWRKSIRAVGLVLIAGLLVVLVSLAGGSSGSLPRQALTRFLSIAANQLVPYTIPGRLLIWKDALQMFVHSPLLGVGYHDYFLYSHVSEIKNGTAAAPLDLPAGLIKQAHNEPLGMLAETGVIGGSLYVGFWFLLLSSIYRLWRADQVDRIWHAFTGGFFASLLGVSFVGEILLPRTPDWVAVASVWWILIAFTFLQARDRSEAPVGSP